MNNDTLGEIFKLLDTITLVKCSQVNKLFMSIVNNNIIWSKKFYNEFGIDLCGHIFFDKNISNKENYFKCRDIEKLGKICKIPIYSLYCINQSNQLDISWKNLCDTPNGIFRFVNLIELNLKANRLITISGKINNLTELQKMYLQGNRLKTVRDEIFQLVNLRELCLSNNELIIIPTEIGQLTNLKKMYLTGNKLTTIPYTIGQLIHLDTLRLDNNQLKMIPDEIGLLLKLKYLHINQNNTFIEKIPIEIGHIIKLEKIYMNRNTIIPNEVRRLYNLKIIYV
jgi:Leucine-rich repeat (LRR) protein